MLHAKNISDDAFNEIIKDQYEILFNDLKLDLTEPAAREALLIQTVLGRAMMGHGIFDGACRPNITMPEIISAIGLNEQKIREYRQMLMDEAAEFFVDLFDGKKDYFTNRNGEPLFRVGFLEKEKIIDPLENILKGAALVARMDTPEWREATVKQNPYTLDHKNFHMGYGRIYTVDETQIKKLGLTSLNLSLENHSKQDLEHLIQKGVIIDANEIGVIEKGRRYIRHMQGGGITDDAALINVGLNYGRQAMLAAFLIDAIDTYSQFGARDNLENDDEETGKVIERLWENRSGTPLITPTETTELIYMGAKNNVPLHNPFSSSHRRFIEYEKGQEGKELALPTILNHLAFVEHGYTNSSRLGFQRVKAIDFYNNLIRRYQLAGMSYLLNKK